MMLTEHTAEFLRNMAQAVLDRKTIQIRSLSGADEWNDLDIRKGICFDAGSQFYRVKPHPDLIPATKELQLAQELRVFYTRPSDFVRSLDQRIAELREYIAKIS